MPGGYDSPRAAQRGQRIIDRIQQPTNPEPVHCWIIPDNGNPIRGTVITRQQVGECWHITLEIGSHE